MGYENKMNLKMSRDKLLERGYCCGLECHNCPYDPPHKKGNKTVRPIEKRVRLKRLDTYWFFVLYSSI